MKKSQLKSLLKEIVKQSLLLENIQDPTKEEMLNYLQQSYGREEGFKDDAEVAMYWFSNFFHGGQSSNLYSVLSTSRFSPGPLSRGPEPQTSEEMMYEDLVLHFAPTSDEAKEIQQKHNSLNEGLSPKNNALIEKWCKELGNRKAAVKMIDSILRQRIGLESADLPDTSTFANGLDDIETMLSSGKYERALKVASNTAKEMVEEEGGEGLFETGQHSIKDLERFAKQEKNPYVRKAMGIDSKQKSKTFFPSKSKPQDDDMDWKNVSRQIDRGTLKENDIPSQMVKQSLRSNIWKAEDARKIPHKDISNFTLGDLQRYYNTIEKFDDSVHVPGRGWGGVKEATESDEDVSMVEYHSPRKGESSFTLRTGNGQEKFEYCNAKYPSGKIDIAVYAYRGDICYGYNHFRKMFNIK